MWALGVSSPGGSRSQPLACIATSWPRFKGALPPAVPCSQDPGTLATTQAASLPGHQPPWTPRASRLPSSPSPPPST